MNRSSRRFWVLGRRVFIVWTNPLFLESVRLLLNHPDIEIIGLTSNFVDAKDDIARLRPDTVIVEELEEGLPTEVLALLESSSRPLRIIGFSMNDNRLNVYHHEERTAVEASDLVSLVNNEA